MNKRNIFKKLSLRKKLLAGLVVVGAGFVLASNLTGVSAIPYQGDQTTSSPVPAFNVFTGNIPAPAPVGGESDFFRGRVPANGNTDDSTTPYKDPVVTDCTDGKVVQMNIYVHNGASVDGNNDGNGPSVAHGTKVKVALPGDTSAPANASISATNAAQVMDNLNINCAGGQHVKIKYVSGSASQYSIGSGEVPLSDSIIGNGVAIRSHSVPGDVWGCWNERVYVVLSVKIEVTPPPVETATCDLFTVLTNSDRKVTVNQYKYTAINATYKGVVVNWGDGTPNQTFNSPATPVGQAHQYAGDGPYTIQATAQFMIGDKPVTSGANCKQVVQFTPQVTPTYSCDLFDMKPEGDEKDRKVKTTAFSVTAKDGAVFKSATINWGDDKPATTVTSVASAVGQTHQYSKDGDYTVTATATFTVNGKDVNASGPQCQKKVSFDNGQSKVPTYTCDLFEIKADTDRTVKVTDFKTTAKDGATFSNAVIDWGDKTQVLTTNNVVGQSHKYGEDKTYTVTATAHFKVDGKDVAASGPNCQQQVTFTSNQPPVVTPPSTPVSTRTGTLVNTGPGSLAILFGAVTGLGMIAYRRLLARSLQD